MKQKPNYGFPLFSVLIRFIFLLFIIIFIVLLIYSKISPFITVLISISLMALYLYFGIIFFKKHFLNYRTKLLKKMINAADLKGNETILDLGTGAGFLAIGFAKSIKNGKVYGTDRYNLKYDNLKTKLFSFIKINFIGNTLKNAKRNVKIENLEKKCEFISADLTKPFNFPDKYFDIILSSQFLYCLPHKKRLTVYNEINRVLKKHGKIIFFESKAYRGWDTKELKEYFEKLEYQINIIKDEKYKVRCIIVGTKL